MSIVARVFILLSILSMLFACGCKKAEETSFINLSFSVEVPEFLEVSPEQSFALFRKMEPKLGRQEILILADKNAPQEIIPMLEDWKGNLKDRYIRIHQFGHNRINVAIYGPGSGTDSSDRLFEAHLEIVIRTRIQELASAPATETPLPHRD